MSHVDWTSTHLPKTFKLFNQKCQLYFSVKDVKKAKQVDHIQLLAGEEGLKCFNSWTLTDTERNNPDHIWRKFDEQIEPKHTISVSPVCTFKVTDNKMASQWTTLSQD